MGQQTPAKGQGTQANRHGTPDEGQGRRTLTLTLTEKLTLTETETLTLKLTETLAVT